MTKTLDWGALMYWSLSKKAHLGVEIDPLSVSSIPSHCPPSRTLRTRCLDLANKITAKRAS